MYEKLTGVGVAVLAADFVAFSGAVVVCIAFNADNAAVFVNAFNDADVAEVKDHNRVLFGRL